MPGLDELKSKWFLNFADETDRLSRRHQGTEVNDYTDGNKVEMLFDGKALMEHFRGCIEKMIRFLEEKEHYPNPPQLWIASMEFANVELLGPKQGGEIEELLLKAVQAGVKIYFLHSGPISQRLWPFGKFCKIKLKKFIRKLNEKKNGFATLDSRTPLWGVQHQKFYVCLWPNPRDWLAVVSSADFNKARWDTSDHSWANNLTHELSIVVRGPAVRDIALTFAERWNDRENLNRTSPQIATLIPTDFFNVYNPVPNMGPHSVQVLRTYPIHIAKRNNPSSKPVSLGYSWSNQGEFTVWGAYLQAIKKAKNYIYIEDQYFSSFILPPAIRASEEFLGELDVVYQLGKALERKVDVIILVSDKNDEKLLFRWLVKHQKRLSIGYLYNMYNAALSKSEEIGRLVIRMLIVNDKHVLVHSKLMIVDDEFVLVGNANIGPRSMTFDPEIQLGIVDEKGEFARELRLEAWKEHLQLTEEECNRSNPDSISNKIKDPKQGITIFSSDKGPGSRRLRSIDTTLLKNTPNRYYENYLMKIFAQPYAGPEKEKFE